MTPRERYRRARIAGGSGLDESEWNKVVEAAATERESHFERITAFEATPSPHHRREHVLCGPGQIPVSAQLLLSVEVALLEAQMLATHLRELARSSDVSLALRERLQANLDRLREQIRRRLGRDDEVKN